MHLETNVLNLSPLLRDYGMFGVDTYSFLFKYDP